MLVPQLVGLYLLIVGVIVLYRRKSIMPAVSQLAANRLMVVILALMELSAGLAIVLTYPAVSWDWMGIVAIVGWVLVIESIIYIAMPYARVQRFIRYFNKNEWYQAGGVVAVIAGAYLSAVGFGLV
ncbi:MAG TPA: hypothetical protein VJL39_00970 [Candidatus Paceibacterota bacterium]